MSKVLKSVPKGHRAVCLLAFLSCFSWGKCTNKQQLKEGEPLQFCGYFKTWLKEHAVKSLPRGHRAVGQSLSRPDTVAWGRDSGVHPASSWRRLCKDTTVLAFWFWCLAVTQSLYQTVVLYCAANNFTAMAFTDSDAKQWHSLSTTQLFFIVLLNNLTMNTLT